MSQPTWYVFAGGGTGGHLFPALAVVAALRGQYPDIDVSFFCTGRPIDRDILGEAGVAAVPQVVQPFPSRPWHWPGFLLRWRRSVAACRRAFGERRPAAVVGAGGYASGPPVHAALALGIPTFLLNPDALPGRANRHLAKRKQLAGIFAQWPVTVGHFPPAAPVIVTGCPVRPAFRQVQAEQGYRRFDLDPRRRTLLVTGASQGARTINEAMICLAERLAGRDWQILHLSGPANQQRVERAYARAAGGGGKFLYRVVAFTERMAEAMAVADLIISRAGASTLAEIIALGKPSILLPYPYHRDQHQRHNAEVLVAAGAAVLLADSRDGRLNSERIGAVLAELMPQDARRSAMADAARSLDRPESAERIAARLAEEAQKSPI